MVSKNNIFFLSRELLENPGMLKSPDELTMRSLEKTRSLRIGTTLRGWLTLFSDTGHKKQYTREPLDILMEALSSDNLGQYVECLAPMTRVAPTKRLFLARGRVTYDNSARAEAWRGDLTITTRARDFIHRLWLSKPYEPLLTNAVYGQECHVLGSWEVSHPRVSEEPSCKALLVYR